MFFVTFLSVKSQDLLSLKPTGYVNDYEKVFTPAQKDTLEKMLSDYEKKTSIEICVVTSADFDFQTQADNLAETWGVGKKGLNNGLLIGFSPSQRFYSVRTGYGLEEFLPDARVNQFTTNMKPAFRAEDYFGGIKELVLNIQNELGSDGYDMMLKNKELKDAKAKAATKAFFSGLLRVVLVLIFMCGIGFLIYLQYKKRKEFLKLKSEINVLLTNIEMLKTSLNFGMNLTSKNVTLTEHQKIIKNLSNGKIDNLTNKLVTEETRSSMQLIYNALLDYKRTINSIDASIRSLTKSKSDIEKYLNDNYPYCADYLKTELNAVLSSLNIDELNTGEYDKKRMNKLIGIESILENKIKSFLSKTAKINAIVVDKQNIDKKVTELNTQYAEYVRKKNILSGAKVGKRYNSLVNLDFGGHRAKICNNILDSFNFLKDGNFDSAQLYYANYITTLAVVNGAFSSVDSLFNEYNKSLKYIKDNKSKVNDLMSDVDGKINKSGVSHSRKSSYSDTKSDIDKYSSAVDNDVILAAGLLVTIISSLEEVYSRIKSDISSYSYSSSSSSLSSSSSYSSSSSSNSFGGFGGGSFGGGGSNGSW
jgi:uncharacterized membrane protein YgcG